jgi:hypothetical protein
MTAKEKAVELVGKYYDSLPQWVNANDAKQCALIAVDEILENFGGTSKKHLCSYLIFEFYEDVKKEIKLL